MKPKKTIQFLIILIYLSTIVYSKPIEVGDECSSQEGLPKGFSCCFDDYVEGDLVGGKIVPFGSADGLRSDQCVDMNCQFVKADEKPIYVDGTEFDARYRKDDARTCSLVSDYYCAGKSRWANAPSVTTQIKCGSCEKIEEETCENDVPGECIANPAVDGTSCGVNHICIKGECIEHEPGVPYVKEPSSYNTLALIIGITIILIIIIFCYLEFSRSKYLKTLSKDKERDELLELDTYITSSLRAGYSANQIKTTLLKSKWSKEMIKKAFESLKGMKTIDKTRQRDELLELRTYIITSMRRGYKEEQVRQELLKDGWKKEMVDKAFESLKKR